jgi:hypothetical protein
LRATDDDSTYPFVLAHEAGHVLLQWDHHYDSCLNIMADGESRREQITHDSVDAAKRLNPDQHHEARDKNDGKLLKHE